MAERMLEGESGWWVGRSGGMVREVVTFCVSREKVVVKRAGMVDGGGTRRSASVSDLQTVRIRSHGRDRRAIRVSCGPLCVPFEDVFLRPPGQGEGNFVFGKVDLEQIVRLVWGGIEVD